MKITLCKRDGQELFTWDVDKPIEDDDTVTIYLYEGLTVRAEELPLRIGRFNLFGYWVEETPQERYDNRLAEHGPAILPDRLEGIIKASAGMYEHEDEDPNPKQGPEHPLPGPE